ncbi:MAG TPA: DUF5320 domain-containing protein [Firmicutes bacterium]|jgi:hypothetical protein|nr:DUF5320 domain-containing protein [Bacillota bacterium]
MPGFDGTGPRGCGPLTGRGLGFCVGYAGGPYAFGRGRHRWFRRMGRLRRFASAPAWYYPDPAIVPEPSAAEEAAFLKEQAQYLEEELKEIKARLADLEQDKEDK